MYFWRERERVVKLNKILYGLIQSPRCWNREINSTLINNNYLPLKSDPCIYFNKNEEGIIKGIIGIYVDDFLIIGKNEEVKLIKELLSIILKWKIWKN